MARQLRPSINIELSSSNPSVFRKIIGLDLKTAGIDIITSLQQSIAKGNALDCAAFREFWVEAFRTDHPELKDSHSTKLPNV